MSLRIRLLLSYAIIIITFVVIAIFVVSFLLRDNPFQRELLTQQLQFAANQITRLTRNAILGNLAPERFILRLGQSATADGARILLVESRSGRILVDSESELRGQNFNDLSANAIDPTPSAGALEIGGARWLYASRPLELQRGAFDVVVAAPFERASLLRDPIFGILINPTLIAAALALIVAALLAIFIARSIARPIQRVAAASNAVAQGQLQQRVPLDGPPEVRELAASFNAMTEQVRASQESQRVLLANVSHELKTPLTSIRGFAQALVDGTANDPESIRRSALIIRDEAERMSRMVSDLLDLARIETGQMPMRRDKVSVVDVLRSCVERLAPRAREAQLNLSLDAPPDLPAIQGDGDRLAQVFNNLLSNAIKHTPSGGRITVLVRMMSASSVVRKGQAWPSGVEVEVADTGRGIPADELSRIFQRFYQVDKSRARNAIDSGLGLGLPIANEIVLAHGGTIHAESVVGIGTRFVVRLPLISGTQRSVV